MTDADQKKRRNQLDGLGRLVRVDEPDSNDNLGLPGSPTQKTDYSYDALGNLIRVSQGSQTRSFDYDSLSRLIEATNPESGTVEYTYDDNGNLTERTDARGVEATYSYDALNRLTERSYSYTGTDSGGEPRDHPGGLRLRQLWRLLGGPAVLGDGQEGHDGGLKDRLRQLRRPGAGGEKHPDHRQSGL